MSRLGIFKISGTEYDLDDLTLDEMEKLEELAGGVSFAELNYGSAKVMKAVAFVLLSRTETDLTWEDVGKVKVIDFMPADEEMPDLPPDSTASEESDSALADNGTLRSVESIAG